MRPNFLFAVVLAVAGVVGLGMTASPAAAQTDSDGCRDGVLARLSNFYINECDPAGPDHYVFAEGTASQQDVAGTKTRIAYAIKDNAAAQTAASIVSSYAAQFRQNGWTVVASGDGRWIAAYRGSASGPWAQVEANGGGNYQIVYVTPAGKGAGASSQAYLLTCDGTRIGAFAQVQGLGIEATMPEYREGDVRTNRVRKIAGSQKYQDVTLSGGTLARPLGDGSPNAAPRARTGANAAGPWQQCQLIVNDTQGAPITTWQLSNPRMMSISTADGATTLTLTYEGYTVSNGTP